MMFWQLILAICAPCALLLAYAGYLRSDAVTALGMAVSSGFAVGSLLCFSLVEASHSNFKQLAELTELLRQENDRLKKRLGINEEDQ